MACNIREATLRDHRLKMLLFLGLILGGLTAAVCCSFSGDYLLAGMGLLLFVWAAARLYRYLDRFNRVLIRFLEAIQYEDFQLVFSREPDLGGSWAALSACFSEVFQLFRINREERERQHRYLQTIVEHLEVGLLSVHQDGRVDFINRAAKNLLKVGRLDALEDLDATCNVEFIHALRSIRHGQKQIVAVEGQRTRFSALVHATTLRMGDRTLNLISLQNIDKILEEKELQAWQSLIRVLTHEIMNSMTPIASLSDTAAGLMSCIDRTGHEALGDVYDALKTIRNRSEGLMAFVSAYRNLALIPKPVFALVRIDDLFARVRDLMQKRLADGGVACETVVDPGSLTLTADASMMEQVLLNLVINALDALEGVAEPQIRMAAGLNENGQTVITIRDNGCGVSETARAKIFIPFFSTKAEGSGIGLSLSRQIMRLHQGYIDLMPDEGVGTTFVLTF